jgi:hypothetical protein
MWRSGLLTIRKAFDPKLTLIGAKSFPGLNSRIDFHGSKATRASAILRSALQTVGPEADGYSISFPGRAGSDILRNLSN